MGGSKARRLAGGAIVALGSVLGLAPLGPAVLQRELDSLRVTYRDDHPDVIRARRALEKALEKRRKAAEASSPPASTPGQGAPGSEGGAAGAQPR